MPWPWKPVSQDMMTNNLLPTTKGDTESVKNASRNLAAGLR